MSPLPLTVFSFSTPFLLSIYFFLSGSLLSFLILFSFVPFLPLSLFVCLLLATLVYLCYPFFCLMFVDSLGNTPLHIAAGRKLKEIVALLMAYGANPAIANGEGDFPSDLPASLLVGAPLISL